MIAHAGKSPIIFLPREGKSTFFTSMNVISSVVLCGSAFVLVLLFAQLFEGGRGKVIIDLFASFDVAETLAAESGFVLIALRGR